MSTPAILIVKYHDEARVTTVHWDGDPRSIGPTLLIHYADNARARALSDLGDLSTIEPLLAPPDGVAHSFAEPCGHVCIAYGRDRGDDPATCAARTYAYTTDHRALLREIWEHEYGAYSYLWTGRTWRILTPVTDVTLATYLRSRYADELRQRRKD